jgi:hypothetical protein
LSVNLCPDRYNHENSNEVEHAYANKYWLNSQIAKNHVFSADWLVGRVAKEDFDVDLRLTNVDLVKFCDWALNTVQFSDLPAEMEILGGLEFFPLALSNEQLIAEELLTDRSRSSSHQKVNTHKSDLNSEGVQHPSEQNSTLSPTQRVNPATILHQETVPRPDTLHTTKVSVYKYRDILDPVIEQAKKMAGNSSEWQEVWPYLSQLAQDEHPPLLGHFEQGIKYSDGVKSKTLTKDAFRKRLERSKK